MSYNPTAHDRLQCLQMAMKIIGTPADTDAVVESARKLLYFISGQYRVQLPLYADKPDEQ